MKQPNILNTKYLLYVGNAYPHKNLIRLLEAIVNVKSQMSNVKLVLVGNEDYFYKQLKEKVKEMGLQETVVFYPEAKREELKDLYEHAMTLVFPSLMEGFGLPAVEAMANNCLVLASDIPVFHEVLGETAIYFNPYAANDIAEKLKSIIDEPTKYESLRIKGKFWVSRYSWEKLAAETLKVYQEALK